MQCVIKSPPGKRWMPLSTCFCTIESLNGTVAKPWGVHTSGSILSPDSVCVFEINHLPLNNNDLRVKARGYLLCLLFDAQPLRYLPTRINHKAATQRCRGELPVAVYGPCWSGERLQRGTLLSINGKTPEDAYQTVEIVRCFKSRQLTKHSHFTGSSFDFR